MEEHSKRAEQLHRQLEAFETELHQSRSRETSYRNQLARALEETRIKSAELIEARQQASSGSVQAQQWRKVSQESDLSIAAAQSTVQIAREEVAMLEFELRRAQDESAALRQELLRADKLIFGVAQHQREPNKSVDREIENAVPRNVTTTKSGSGRFPAAQHHSSVIYATPNKELSNNKHKKDIQSAVRPSVKAASGKSVSNVAVVAAPSPFAYRTVLNHRTR
jgi:chromosome segregation ATPase